MPEVWTVDVAAEVPRLATHVARLTAEESARAARFHRDEDRHRFVVARSTRRELLATILGVEPAVLAFEDDRYGKPRLRPGAGATPPQFNSSHSGRWVLHAIADVEVGVDVEQVRPDFANLDDFLWVLSPEERAFVQAAAPTLRAAALATVWVRKEAYVKAVGEGLSRSLPEIGIVAGDASEPSLSYDRNLGSPGRRWSFTDLAIDDSHKACVVHEGPRRNVVVRAYRPSRN